MLSEISDDTLMELVEKHFNAVTFGNELKPDALFNYQIDGNSVPTKTITFEGEELPGSGCERCRRQPGLFPRRCDGR